LQFGCQGTRVLLRQQQGHSAPCFTGASFLCMPPSFAPHCERNVLAARRHAPAQPHARIPHAARQATLRPVAVLSLLHQLKCTTCSCRCWRSVRCARPVTQQPRTSGGHWLEVHLQPSVRCHCQPVHHNLHRSIPPASAGTTTPGRRRS
jgi:hypothetical protein